jgi:hypothetical protein
MSLDNVRICVCLLIVAHDSLVNLIYNIVSQKEHLHTGLDLLCTIPIFLTYVIDIYKYTCVKLLHFKFCHKRKPRYKNRTPQVKFAKKGLN